MHLMARDNDAGCILHQTYTAVLGLLEGVYTHET